MWQMARLTNKDYLEILNLIYLANRCGDVGSFTSALFPSIMRAFHVECATFHLVKGYPKDINIGESRSFKLDSHNLHEDKYYCPLYTDSFYHYSPLLKEALSSSKNILKIGESISFRDWERTILYNDFIRPQHLYWELFLTLRWKNNLEGMITLWRPKNQPDYEDREVLKAAKLASHLGITIHNINLISQANSRESQFLSPDEADGEGLLCLDHKFNPYFFNAKARDICLQLSSGKISDIFNFKKGKLPIPSYVTRDCSGLLDLVKAEGQPILLPKERIVSTESGQRFRIECSLIWKVDQISSTPNFIVTLSDLNDENKLESTLQTKFRLSRRELDVTHYLIRGMSDNEIGEKLYISRQTVHTHIKNIYRKIGAKSRIELYRMVIQEGYSGILSQTVSYVSSKY
jgi:DNA-binding CsgD family transcriptional regulator